MAANDRCPEGWDKPSPSGTTAHQMTGTNMSQTAGNVYSGTINYGSVLGDYYGTRYYSTATGSIVPNTWTQPTTTTTLTAINELMGLGKTKLTQTQLKLLIDSHQFVVMDDGSQYCLFCYALDQYRTRAEHDHVIHEE